MRGRKNKWKDGEREGEVDKKENKRLKGTKGENGEEEENWEEKRRVEQVTEEGGMPCYKKEEKGKRMG